MFESISGKLPLLGATFSSAYIEPSQSALHHGFHQEVFANNAGDRYIYNAPYSAHNAIDGNLDPNWPACSGADAWKIGTPWLSVELIPHSMVDEVYIFPVSDRHQRHCRGEANENDDDHEDSGARSLWPSDACDQPKRQWARVVGRYESRLSERGEPAGPFEKR